MENADDRAAATRGRSSKVQRLIDEYGLDGMGDELERLWTVEGDQRRSLRELADYFNLRLLERAISDADIHSLDGEVENLYSLLTDAETGTADRNRARRHLQRQGIDVDQLESDFVSYQAIRTYLKSHRGAEYTPDSDPVERAQTNIQQLRSRLSTVTESKVERLDASDTLDVGDLDILVDVRVVCNDCGGQYDIQDLFDRGGCECG